MYNYIIVNLKYYDFEENCLLLLQTIIFFCYNFVKLSFRGFGIDRKNNVNGFNSRALGLLIYFPKLFFYILGNSIFMWFYVALLHLYANRRKTQKT